MKDLRKRFKKIRQTVKDDKFDLDDEGREIVDITISDSENLLSIYNPDGKKIISTEMANVIDNSTKSTSINKDIHLRFSCNSNSPEKEDIYKQAIKNYYLNEFADKERRLHNNFLITIFVFVMAVLFLALFFILEKVNCPWYLNYFIEIVAWVFAWETVDLIFFQRQLIRYEQRKDLQIIYAHITFLEIEKQDKF